MARNYYFFIFILSFVMGASAQDIVDPELNTLFVHIEKTEDYSKPLKNSKNEVSMLISATFLFYKTFISSQDKPSCVFTPSCSVYSMQAFQKKGLFMGWLYTFDRLTRCSPFADPHFYIFDTKQQRFYDPVE